MRHWNRLEEFYRCNHEEITYQSIRNYLLGRSVIDSTTINRSIPNDCADKAKPSSQDCVSNAYLVTEDERAAILTKFKENINRWTDQERIYGQQVNDFIDKLTIEYLDLEILIEWLKRLRPICGGNASNDQYLIGKLLTRALQDKNINNFLVDLIGEIKCRVELHQSRYLKDETLIGKNTKKELNVLNAFLDSIASFLIK